jgi:hypothetical protein
VGENMAKIMQYFFLEGGILWAIPISRLVILGEYALVIIPPSPMGKARPVHFGNDSLFKTNELTKPQLKRDKEVRETCF